MKSNIQKLLSIPPTIVIKKVCKLPFKPLLKITTKHKGISFIANYLKFLPEINPSHFEINFDNFFTKDTIPNFVTINNILNHQFDLLGSGLVTIGYGEVYNGFLGNNFSNPIQDTSKRIDLLPAEHKEFSEKIIAHISNEYKPIDWFVDFRSGYRWGCEYYNKIKYGNNEGVDIKVTWELARLQHIFDMSLAYRLVDFSWKEKVLAEITNQLLDFISMNPPFYGPNWVSPMEVSIRSVNIIFTILELQKNGVILPKKILTIINNYLYISYLFIKLHPEWNDGLRNNHYFANLLGQIVLFKYLFGREDEKFYFELYDKFKKELKTQFFDDGGNFEGSIPYHILSFEIVYWIVHFLKDFVINDKKTLEKLKKICEFNSLFNNLNSEFVQIGDNDSGKIINIKCLNNFNYNFQFLSYIFANLFELKYLNNIEQKIFKDFGLIYLKKNDFKLFVSLGRKAQFGKGGHNHNDSQSFILLFNNTPIFVDPGSYVYTASVYYRNKFRSSLYHNKLSDLSNNNEFNDNLSSLFWFNDKQLDYIFYKNDDQEIVKIIDRKPFSNRKYLFDNNELKIVDLIKNSSHIIASFHLHPNCSIKTITPNEILISNGQSELLFSSSVILNLENYLYSPSYGICVESKKIIAELQDITNFEISFIIKKK